MLNNRNNISTAWFPYHWVSRPCPVKFHLGELKFLDLKYSALIILKNWNSLKNINTANSEKYFKTKLMTFMYFFKENTIKALAHYKDFLNNFSKKNRFENRCPYIKLLKKLLQLWRKVVVCMEDNKFFVVTVVVCEGLNNLLK